MAVHADCWTVPPSHMKALEEYTSTRSGDWFVVNADPQFMKYCLHQRTGDLSEFLNIELDISPVLDLNAELRNNSIGKRWGDGQKVATVPSSLLFNDNALHGLGRALREGDRKKSKRILNDSDYSKLRTFGGKV